MQKSKLVRIVENQSSLVIERVKVRTNQNSMISKSLQMCLLLLLLFFFVILGKNLLYYVLVRFMIKVYFIFENLNNQILIFDPFRFMNYYSNLKQAITKNNGSITLESKDGTQWKKLLSYSEHCLMGSIIQQKLLNVNMVNVTSC